MKLIAIRELTYAGKALAAGDPFDSLSDDDAKVLKAAGRAKDAPPEKPIAQEASTETRAMKSEEGGADLLNPSPSGRRYNRRDLRAKE